MLNYKDVLKVSLRTYKRKGICKALVEQLKVSTGNTLKPTLK